MARWAAVLLAFAALAAPGRAGAATWDFRTPGHAAYCRLEFAPVKGGSVFNAFRCMAPSTGFWLRLEFGRGDDSVRITKGYDRPGFKPHVRPLFRAHGVWCGIDLDTLEPSAPTLECWRPADGALLAIGHGAGYRGSYGPREQAIGFRPRGFRVLGTGRTSTWRCRKVEPSFAERCSTGAGEAVFTCRSATVR